MAKYVRLRDRVLADGVIAPGDLIAAAPASNDDLARAHNRDYIASVMEGTLSAAEQRRIGFPWSPALARRSRTTVGATIGACRAALEDGAAANLAGGTHHAYADHGEGYCIFNDVVVAARAMQAEGRVRRVVVIDLDVHQGNGTAAITRGDPTITTYSVHGAKNYPFYKEQSDIDIELADGTGDADYLALAEEGARRAIAWAGADLAIYIAGADPYQHDRLGRMALTIAGLALRDRMVFDRCHEAGLPVAVVMGGGYAPNVEDIVRIHATTIRLAASLTP